jgi:ribosome-binding protein aMBF1 (putative translation factor)
MNCNVAFASDTTFLSMKQRPSEQLWKDFGAWIRQAREDLRLTQEEAAKRTGSKRGRAARAAIP